MNKKHNLRRIQNEYQGSRRGNSIVLVTALLVLLVIIATAYVTRTTAGRSTARAVRTAEARDANAQVIGEMLADFPAQALFVNPVTPLNNQANYSLGNPSIVADSNDPRLPAQATSSLYNTAPSRYNVDFAYPYNFAPMHDVAFTNWPDNDTLSLQLGANYRPNAWPTGPGSTSGGNLGALMHEGNPLGNPGFGDSRWLADLEPIRLDLDDNGTLETFSHWRHMTYLARPENGWRLCLDIANVGDSTLVRDLTIPVEQWLAAPHPSVLTSSSGNTPFSPGNLDNWINWTSGLFGYQQAMELATVGDYSRMPSNFFRLRDLNADGVSHNWTAGGDRPQSEFVLDSARNLVSRFLADTDGDGYTDAFWFLAPIPIKDGIRYVVSARIIANSAMIDVNTATRFQYSDTVNFNIGGVPGANSRTKGHTPADIGLVSQAAPFNTVGNTLNTGFYDDPFNQFYGNGDRFDYYIPRWSRHVQYTGMPYVNTATPGTLNQYLRLDYWRRAGLNPLTANSISGYQPFTLADELELRMFFGQNYEYIYSRYEQSVQANNETVDGTTLDNFVRAEQGWPEMTEIAGQLVNQSLVADQRHRITTISSVRNELLAPWLRDRWAADTQDVSGATVPGGDGVADYDSLPAAVQKDIDDQVAASGAADPATITDIHRVISERYLAQNRLKVDLRDPVLDPYGAIMYPVTGLNTNPPHLPVNPGWLSLRERLPLALYHALDDGPRYDGGNLVGSTYFGNYSEAVVSGGPGSVPLTSNLSITRDASTSFAANILAYRDQDDQIHLSDDPSTPAVEGPLPLPAVPGLPADDDRQFLGVERQPFITEVFIGHVYEVLDVPDTDINGSPYLPPDERVVLHHPGRHSTVVVVQIANPFDKPIDLRQYKISVFGHTYSGLTTLPSALNLLPATPETPNTAIFYAMKDGIGQATAPAFQQKWLDFLDIQAGDLTPNTIVRQVSGDWPVERDPYDSAPDDVDAVQLIRVVEDPPGSGTFVDVVVDRIDKGEGGEIDRAFSDAVRGLEDNKPPDQEFDPPEGYEVPPFGAPYQGYPTWHMELPHDHWVQWVRCTRAWGVNFDGSVDSTGRETYQQDERSPRYVFSDRAVITGDESEMPAPYPADASYDLNGNGGNKYEFAKPPDDDGTGGTVPVPWFRRDYHSTVPDPADPEGDAPTLRTGKPTFFDMKRDGMTLAQYQGNQFPYPDKGWYGQVDSGDLLLDDDDVIGQPYGGGHNANRHMAIDSGRWRVRHNFSMQMLQKDGDFEQIGEVLNVPIWGIELAMNCGGATCAYDHTTKTYSESLSDALKEASSIYSQRVRANRLGGGEQTLGVGDPNAPADPLHYVPDQPALARVLDLFVCDSYGSNSFDLNNNDSIEANETFEAEARRFSNANGFSGNPVYGMININPAPAEVMRALPHWSRIIYEAPGTPSRSYLAEAAVQYRERFSGDPALSYGYRNQIDVNGDGTPESFDDGPNYSNRDNLLPNINNMRGDRGYASIGELLMLTQSGVAPDPVDQNRWSVEFAGMNPFQRFPTLNRFTTRLCTDAVEDLRYKLPINTFTFDRVAGDAEEMNMLFSGASNMITTRGDTFTIYFRVRAFKQNPVSGRWDATDPEYIVDDSRYVMCVDRSNVNSPSDKPRILFFEKCPN